MFCNNAIAILTLIYISLGQFPLSTALRHNLTKLVTSGRHFSHHYFVIMERRSRTTPTEQQQVQATNPPQTKIPGFFRRLTDRLVGRSSSRKPAQRPAQRPRPGSNPAHTSNHLGFYQIDEPLTRSRSELVPSSRQPRQSNYTNTRRYEPQTQRTERPPTARGYPTEPQPQRPPTSHVRIPFGDDIAYTRVAVPNPPRAMGVGQVQTRQPTIHATNPFLAPPQAASIHRAVSDVSSDRSRRSPSPIPMPSPLPPRISDLPPRLPTPERPSRLTARELLRAQDPAERFDNRSRDNRRRPVTAEGRNSAERRRQLGRVSRHISGDEAGEYLTRFELEEVILDTRRREPEGRPVIAPERGASERRLQRRRDDARR